MNKTQELRHSFEKTRVNWTEQKPDGSKGNYYVSVTDAGKVGLLLGPFKRHMDALARVFAVKGKAIDLNAKAAFYAFGTVKMADSHTKPGLLNKHFGM